MAITNGSVQIVCNATLSRYGGDLYVGIMTVINSVREIITMPVTGLTNGAQPVMSFNYGARRHARVKSAIKFTTIVCILFSCFMWALLLAFPRFFIHMFNSEPELLAEGVPAMHLLFRIFYDGTAVCRTVHIYCTWESKTSRILLLATKGNHRHSTDTVASDYKRAWNKWSLSCRAGFQLHRRNRLLCHDDLYRMEKTG